jgi:hypothetical protein
MRPGEGKSVAARHAEVARRYAWQAKQKSREKRPRLLTLVRLRELERLYEDRWGRHLPDDDAGRDDLVLAAHHVARLGGEVSKHIVAWARLWAPWMQPKQAAALAAKVKASPRKFRAETLGRRLRLTDDERTRLGITTIRPFDVGPVELAQRRKQRSRERSAAYRRRQRVGAARPEPASRTRPWEALGMSRRTWYRRGKPTITADATEPVKGAAATMLETCDPRKSCESIGEGRREASADVDAAKPPVAQNRERSRGATNMVRTQIVPSLPTGTERRAIFFPLSQNNAPRRPGEAQSTTPPKETITPAGAHATTPPGAEAWP